MRRGGACLLLGALALSGCDSPEATRVRGGDFGADIRNIEQPVTIHHGAEPYYRTPCVTEPVECSGPPAVFGPSPARE